MGSNWRKLIDPDGKLPKCPSCGGIIGDECFVTAEECAAVEVRCPAKIDEAALEQVDVTIPKN